jgi:hypothetical protein
LEKLRKDELCRDKGGNGGVVLLQRIFKEQVEIEEGGEEGRASGYILNITHGLTDGIILMVTPSAILSVSMSRYCMVCLFESHCNSIGNDVCKHLHVIVLFSFFIHSIPTGIPSVYTDNIFSSVFIDRVSDGQICSVKITAKYRRRKSVSVSICIRQFSGSDSGKRILFLI